MITKKRNKKKYATIIEELNDYRIEWNSPKHTENEKFHEISHLKVGELVIYKWAMVIIPFFIGVLTGNVPQPIKKWILKNPILTIILSLFFYFIALIIYFKIYTDGNLIKNIYKIKKKIEIIEDSIYKQKGDMTTKQKNLRV